MDKTPNKAQMKPDFSVTQVRGPFLDLEPHPEHCNTTDEFRDYCARMRRQGKTLAVDLFAGAGGISLGLEEAGFKVVLGVDHYAEAVKTHRHHFGGMSLDWDLSTADSIERVATLMRECEIEILAGGPPCQPFSLAGRNGIRALVEKGKWEPHDQRRDLWRSYLEIAARALPKALIMENVPDMALDDEMFILRSMIEELEQLGYSVYERVVETWRYGVPQTRQRLIMVALRDGLEFRWPEDYPEKVTLNNAIADMPPVEGGWRPEGGAQGWIDYEGPKTEFQKYMRRNVSEEDSGKLFDHITRPVRADDREAFELMDSTTKYSDLPEHLRRYRADTYVDKYHRLDGDDLSRTITAHISKDGYSYIHPTQPRTITVREAARIQTFPDNFRFNGPPSAAFKQIGNAVPPRAAGAIASAIVEALERAEKKKTSARETSELLAHWFRERRESARLNPWLWTDSRWKATLGELFLARQKRLVVEQVWSVIEAMPEPNPENLALGEPVIDFLCDWAQSSAGSAKAEKIKGLWQSIKKAPRALWEPKIDREVLPEIGRAEANVIELITLKPSHNTDTTEEHVLNTRGISRLTSRFQSISNDRRNRQTDGRLAVARMLALNPDSRQAHLALFELAQSHCVPSSPHCSDCPLNSKCDKFEVDDSGRLF